MRHLLNTVLMVSLIAAPGFWSCTQQEEATPEIVVTEVAVEAPFNIIAVGETLALSATLAPENAADKAVTWRSNNPRIATVDETGTVTGIGSGLVNITCAAKENLQVKNTVELQVVEVLVPVTSLVIQDLEKDVLEGGETIQLITIINPQESTDKTVIWSSDNEAVATVNETGLVTGVRDGSVTITATSKRYPTKTSSVALNVVTTTNDILSFSIKELSSVQPFISDTKIIFEIDFNNEGKALNVAALTPVIQHNGLSIVAETGDGFNFTDGPVSYTVTSGTGLEQIYQVSVRTKPETEFITVWSGREITIPVDPSYDYNYNVDWDDDGFIEETAITGAVTHQFDTYGEHKIRISGQFPAFRIDNAGKEQLVAIEQWGTVNWHSMLNAFLGCSRLEVPATDVPDLSRVSTLAGMFQEATNANPQVSDWNTTSVTDIAFMFFNATNANPEVSHWNTAKVTDMEGMFRGADRANPDVSTWTISKVTDLYRIFYESGITRENYEKALIRFAAHAENPNEENLTLPFALNLGSDPTTTYCSEEATYAKSLLESLGWSNLGNRAVDCP